MSDYVTFRSFYSEDEALTLQDFLLGKEIDARLDKEKPVLDKIYRGYFPEQEYFVRLRQADFSRAEKEINDYILANPTDDNYLHDFTQDELVQIIHSPDEWSNQAVVTARQMLEKQGIHYSQEEIEQIKTKRIISLSRPEKVSTGLLVLGYILTLTTFGAIFGLILYSSKKTLPDGRKVASFDANARENGKQIAIISIVLLVLYVIFALKRGASLLFILPAP